MRPFETFQMLTQIIADASQFAILQMLFVVILVSVVQNLNLRCPANFSSRTLEMILNLEIQKFKKKIPLINNNFCESVPKLFLSFAEHIA